MKFNQFAILLFVTTCFSSLTAQEFELGKVSVAELQEKSHPKDTAAIAAILFKKGVTSYEHTVDAGFMAITEVSVRIKVYKKEGYVWANKEVKFREDNSIKESVIFSNEVTYNLVGGNIEKTKLKREGEFEEKIDRYWNKKKITMPNVREGSIIEYRYTIRSKDVGSLRDFYFQANIPVNYARYITYIPDFVVYNTRFKGFITPKISVDGGRKSFEITDKVRTTSRGVSSTEFKKHNVDYQETITTYLAENVPAIKEEAYVNNVDNYTISLAHELSMTRFPNESFQTFTTDWESVTKSIYDFVDFGSELNKTGYFEDDLKDVIAGLTTTNEKISAIYNFVKNKVKWNSYYGYSCNDGVKKAYNDNAGNVAEINLMLTAMLRYANLTANPVLVSTRSNGIAMFPNRTAFNYVIAAVETPQGMILLDASDKFSTPNILPLRALNWTGRLVRKDGTSEAVDLMPKTVSNNTVMMNYSIDANGLVSGKLRKQQADYNAMVFRDNVANVEEDAYLEKLENANSKIEIKEYSRANEENLTLPVMETYSFSGSNLCERIGGKMYLSPMLFFTDRKNPFKQEVRAYPVDYSFPFSEKFTINIQIPDGYKVEQIPAPTVITMADSLGSFKYMTTSSQNSIQVSIIHQINTAIISAENYTMLKEYYQGMISKENEKIILTKI